MIPDHVLRSIEQECCELVCPDCGGRHSVSLRDVGGSGAVTVSFSDDACETFKGAALNKAHVLVKKFLGNPFPLLR